MEEAKSEKLFEMQDKLHSIKKKDFFEALNYMKNNYNTLIPNILLNRVVNSYFRYPSSFAKEKFSDKEFKTLIPTVFEIIKQYLPENYHYLTDEIVEEYEKNPYYIWSYEYQKVMEQIMVNLDGDNLMEIFELAVDFDFPKTSIRIDERYFEQVSRRKGDPRVEKLLLKMVFPLDDGSTFYSDSELLESLMERLVRSNNKEIYDGLLDIYYEVSPKLQIYIDEIIIERNDDSKVEILITNFEDETRFDKERKSAIYTLSLLKTEKHIKFMKKTFDQEDKYYKLFAAKVLIETKHDYYDKAVRFLLDNFWFVSEDDINICSYKNQEQDVYYQAIACLGEKKAEYVLSYLVEKQDEIKYHYDYLQLLVDIPEVTAKVIIALFDEFEECLLTNVTHHLVIVGGDEGYEFIKNKLKETAEIEEEHLDLDKTWKRYWSSNCETLCYPIYIYISALVNSGLEENLRFVVEIMNEYEKSVRYWGSEFANSLLKVSTKKDKVYSELKKWK